MKFFIIALTLFIAGCASQCSIPDEELDLQRREAFIQMQISPGFTCGNFFQWLNESLKADDPIFMLPRIGAYIGPDQIQEYYQLALQPGDGCSNFANTQFLRLDNTPLPSSIVKISDNVYEGYHITDGSFNPGPNGFEVVTKGHLTYAKVEFVPCSHLIDHWLTGVENDELTTVSVANSPVSSPIDICGLTLFAQQTWEARFGFNPANISGFDFSLPNNLGFFDCIGYWSTIQARGDVCGTPLSAHNIQCANLHASTFLTEGSRPVHVEHWAKEPLHTKCIDSCNPVLATCDSNASAVPRNKINFDNGVIEYFCQCPEGWVGDGLATGSGCQPVTCSADWECDPYQFTFCDIVEGVCKPRDTFEWDRDTGKAICPEDSNVFYNNGHPECVLNWRYNERWQCQNQKYTRVQCKLTGNLATPELGACVCNQGFTGGYVVDCECESGNTVFVSGEEYCLGEGECAFNWNCNQGQTCSVPFGEPIGTCQ